MNLSVGIVGLPNVGKSTLFNALLKKQQALVADYPFTTIEPNIGIVPVPDENLEKIQKIEEEEYKKEKIPIVPSTVKFIDIAGLVKGAHEGQGLGNKFLSHIREVSVVAHVLKLFGEKSDPLKDYETVKTELALGGIEGKPEIIVLNIEEDQYKLDSIQKLCQDYMRILNLKKDGIVVISAKIESELSGLSDSEQKEYLSSLGLSYSGLERLIKKGYELLDLISFYTTKGGKEVRSWPIKKGTKSIDAAEKVHTDFAKKFIKGEVVSVRDFLQFNGWKGGRVHGKTRLEGRDYVVQDGDMVEFKIGG